MKTILHISDLHVSDAIQTGRPPSEARDLANAVVRDVQEQGISADTLIISGDLAYHGRQEEYKIFHEETLSPLMKGLNISESGLIICPGNHDCDLMKIDEYEEMANEMINSNGVTESIEKLVKKKTSSGVLRQSDYYQYAEGNAKKNVNLVSCNPVFQTYIYNENSNKIAVIVANSSIFAVGGLKDKGRLALTRTQLDMAYETVKRNADQLVCVMHHPLDWLHESERQRITDWIISKVDLLVYGHMHEFTPEISEIHGDVTIKFQTGAFDAGQVGAGYTIINFDEENRINTGSVKFRRLSKPTKDDTKAGRQFRFSSWDERGHNGALSYSLERLVRFNLDVFAKRCADLEADVDSSLIVNSDFEIAKRKLVDIFEKPVLMKDVTFDPSILATVGGHNEGAVTVTANGAGESNRMRQVVDAEMIEFDQIMRLDKSYIISGLTRHGKTTALKYIYATGLARCKTKNIDRVHCFVNYRDVAENNKGRLSESVIDAYESTGLRGQFTEKLNDMLKRGRCIICIDDYDALVERSHGYAKAFIDKYPNNIFIIAMHESVYNEIATERDRLSIGDRFTRLSLTTVRRKNLRSLIQKLSQNIAGIKEKEQDEVYNLIVKTVKGSRLPSNQFVFSMLYEIYNKKHSLDGILTESDIIENFVEMMLRKHYMNERSEKDPPYKTLIHFLGFVSSRIVLSSNSALTRNRLYEYALEYNEACSFTYEADRYISPLIKNGILKEQEGGQLIFAQKCFFDFVAAKYMSSDAEFREFVLHETNYLNADKIIEYYSAQGSKNDRDLIENIKLKLEAEYDKVDRHVSGLYPHAKDEINDLIRGKPVLEKIEVLELLPDPESLVADKDANDAALDEIDPLENHEAASSAMLPIEDLSIYDRLERSLSLMSRVCKNSQFLMDPAYQDDLYRYIVSKHFDHMGICMLIMKRELAPEVLRMLKEFVETGALHMKEDLKVVLNRANGFLNLILALIPRMIQKSLLSDLGIPTQRPIIERLLRAPGVSEDVKVMLTFLYSDLELPDHRQKLKDLVKNPIAYIRLSLYIKLCEILKNDYKLTQDEKSEVKALAIKLAKNTEERHALEYLELSRASREAQAAKAAATNN